MKLVGLLEEAVARATDLARSRNPDLDVGTADEIGRTVGIGAIRYADLSVDRTKDYVLDWERMLALAGNTAPCLQYAYARIRSVLRRAGTAVRPDAPIVVAQPAERALAVELLGFAGVVGELEGSLEFISSPVTCTDSRPRSTRSTSAARCCVPRMSCGRAACCWPS
ncbi:Arginine--tRNA ligase [Micromonospora noduli]|uniref:arginine--tRNA ligase n=1 Tax=Micromonospora noduli TaxID=709876 RepID=A0ABX9CX66_9ACTN|nr:Arginine--tRNA ligase [Micromonospora noduli]